MPDPNATPTGSAPPERLRYRQDADHLSARDLGEGDLPWFTVIAGPNGSGKTHLLQAIDNGHVRLLVADELVDPDDIRLFDWTTLHVGNQQEAQPSVIMQRAEQLWNVFSSQLSGGQVRQRLTAFLKEHPGIPERAALSADPSSLLTDQTHVLSVERLQADLLQVALEAVGHNRALLGAVAGMSVRSVFSLGAREFRQLAQTQLGLDDPLQHQLSQTFLAYKALLDENELAMFRAQRGDKGQVYLEVEEFESTFGRAPWDVLDGLLADRGLNFAATRPESGNDPFAVELINQTSGISIPFSDLSSGERVLLGLAVAVYGVTQNRQAAVRLPRALLLDEIDAPLHPEMTRTMLSMLHDAFILNSCAVVMTTHSISTVALAPSDSIVYMKETVPRLEAVHPGIAISRLSAGITALPYDNAERIICAVESSIDADLYTRTAGAMGGWLDRSNSLVFLPARASRGEGGRTEVTKVVKAHREQGRLFNYFGVVDRDSSDPASVTPPIYSLGNRYSIENYLCDPLLIAALLARGKHLSNSKYSDLALAVGVQAHPGTWGGLKLFDDTQLQQVVDQALTHLGSQGDATLVSCGLVSGRAVRLPRWVLERQGHSLAEDWVSAFPELNQYGRDENRLVKAVGSLVVPDVPELLSSDFADLFRTIDAAFSTR